MGVKVVTGLVRFSYANVWKPKEDDNGNKKYSAALLFPKKNKNALKALIESINEAIKEGVDNGTFQGKNPGTFNKKNSKLPKFSWCLRDGEEKEDDNPEYEGMMFLNASSKEAPLIGDADRQEIVDEEDFYSGCWGRAAIVLFPFNTDGNMGIGAYLQSVQKLRDGEKLAGRESLDSAFADDIDEDEFDVIEDYGGEEDDEDDLDADDIL